MNLLLLLLLLLFLLLLHTTFVDGQAGYISERDGGVTISSSPSSSFLAFLAIIRGRIVYQVRVRVHLLQLLLSTHDATTKVV